MSDIVKALVWEADIKPAPKKFVMIALADEATDAGLVVCPIAQMVPKLGMSESTLYRHLNTLESTDGLILREDQWTGDYKASPRATNIISINLRGLMAIAQTKKPVAPSEAVNAFDRGIAAGQTHPVSLTGRPADLPAPGPRSLGGRPGDLAGPGAGTLAGPISDSESNLESNERRLSTGMTAEHLVHAEAIMATRTQRLADLGFWPRQLGQLKERIARALAEGYDPADVEKYFWHRASAANVATYLLNAFLPKRLPEIPHIDGIVEDAGGVAADVAALQRRQEMLALEGDGDPCGECEAKPGDPVHMRKVTTKAADFRGAAQRNVVSLCPRCHPKVRETPLTAVDSQ